MFATTKRTGKYIRTTLHFHTGEKLAYRHTLDDARDIPQNHRDALGKAAEHAGIDVSDWLGDQTAERVYTWIGDGKRGADHCYHAVWPRLDDARPVIEY